jgi:putative cardiolipin synthase
VLLANAAERTLDVQYYIWRADMSGTRLLDALRRAAARGMRVRMLLDDNSTSGLDSTLAAFAALPNVQVRLFKPFASRDWRALSFLGDFERTAACTTNRSRPTTRPRS